MLHVIGGIFNSSINEMRLPGVNKFYLGATSACCVHGMHPGTHLCVIEFVVIVLLLMNIG